MADCTLDLESWGVRFRLAADDPTLLERMRRSAPFGSSPSRDSNAPVRTFALRKTGPHAGFQIVGEGEALGEEEALDAALYQLGGHLMIYVAEHAPDYIFVHAGVVALRGRALLLPGVSFAGKSTLVAELVRAGATYYSDEFALIDREGFVHPFSRDLRMRRPGRPEQTPVPVEQLQGCSGTCSVPIALVVFTHFAPDAVWSPEPISAGRAALEMLLHTAPVQRTPARVLTTFAAVMRQARAWRTPRGEASLAASALLSGLETLGAVA